MLLKFVKSTLFGKELVKAGTEKEISDKKTAEDFIKRGIAIDEKKKETQSV